LFSDPHNTHKYTCGQNAELLNVKIALHIVTTGIYKGYNNIFNMKHINIQITVSSFFCVRDAE